MRTVWLKQPTLKPQDVLVALKICVTQKSLSYSEMGRLLSISPSEVHSAANRAATSNLLTRNTGNYEPNRASIREFLIHGIKYFIPLVVGGLGRGLPTGVSAPPLSQHFEQTDALPLVWPHDQGVVRGITILPFHHSVPEACLMDEKLYRLLSVVDALRGGAAREREIAQACLESVLR